MTITRTFSLAMAAILITGASIASAQDRSRSEERKLARFERLDADKNGSISLEEMVAATASRFDESDTDQNGELTVAELADRMQRRRMERRAKRMLKRMDYNGDGKVTKAELESRARKRFALMDRNDDGVVEKSELREPRRGGNRRHHRGNRKFRDRDL